MHKEKHFFSLSYLAVLIKGLRCIGKDLRLHDQFADGLDLVEDVLGFDADHVGHAEGYLLLALP